MTFVFALGLALAVLIAGLWGEDGVFAALVAGLGLGAWFSHLVDRRIRAQRSSSAPPHVDAALQDIHWRLKRLEDAGALGPSPMETAAGGNPPAPGTAEATAPLVDTPAAATAVDLTLDPALLAPAAPEPAPPTGWHLPPAPPATPASAAPPSAQDNAIDRLVASARDWLLGGNTVVRAGIVILFFGVAFLLKFAAENAVLPLELRVAGVGAGAIALLGLGWRLRTARRAYGLALQGAGIGLLYLTLFGAFRLYAMVPAGIALATMVAVSLFSAVLAVRQDARALIALGVAGGFLAPVLASTGSGNHVALFSYYAALNLGIFAVAWFKAWRPLNLLGFVFTFGIGLVWGASAYRPEHFASTEPFLILFFAMFLVISLLFAERQADSAGHWLDAVTAGRLPPRIVDGTLVFGLPLVAFGLQAGLVRGMPFALAYSALVLAALYLGLARWLQVRGRADLVLLKESFLALGVIFATLAIPLALDARWTSASWALEGAALVWVGVHQQRRLARAAGLLLQLAAALAYVAQAAPPAPLLPVLNSWCVGAALIALSALFSAWQLATRGREHLLAAERAGALVVLLWGLLWWLVAGLGEADRQLAPAAASAVAVTFVALTAAAFSLLQTRLDWTQARLPAAGLMPALALLLLSRLVASGHPFAGGGVLAWPLALLLQGWLLRRHDGDAGLQGWYGVVHALGLWVVAALGSRELLWLAQQQELASGWRALALVLPPGLVLLAASQARGLDAWPRQHFAASYLGWGAWPLVAWLALWSLASNFFVSGAAHPLPYLPLLNPADLGQAFALLVVLRWQTLLRRQQDRLSLPLPGRFWLGVAGALVFLWLNAMLLRAIHHWAGVPYTLPALLDSMLVQASLSLFWSVLALLLMLCGARTQQRPLWLLGAALMAVVVAKLFLVDLSSISGMARIVSFIGVGLLMLLIGYLAPVPPKTATGEES